MPDETFFLDEATRQPAVLQALLDRRNELDELITGRPKRIVAFGCGDSYVSALAAQSAFRVRHEAYEPVPALEFLTYQHTKLTAQDLVIPISMSGNVDRTVAGMQRAQERGATALAITNATDGQLAQHAEKVFNLQISEPAPFLSSTVSYTSTIFTLLLLAGAGSDEERGLTKVIEAMPAVTESSREIAQRAAKTHYDSQTIYILASGPNMATATHGAMKFAELANALAVPQELEEFAHQQFWILRPNDLVIILNEEGGPEELARHFTETLTDYGIPTVVVTQNPSVGERSSHAFDLPAVGDGNLSPLLMCLPLQLLAYYWSYARGLNPNTRAHLKEDTRRFETSRRLTRKALIGTGL
jgi:fructoselysine-6-P-deglycase FrlB-like protein